MNESEQNEKNEEEDNSKVHYESKHNTCEDEENILIDLKRDTQKLSINQLQSMLMKEIHVNDSILISIPEF